MTEETEGKVAGFLGLCTRAGQMVFGQDACVDTVRRRNAAVVLLDEESSENTRKRFMDKCRTHGTPLYGLRAEVLSRAVGKDGRKVAVVKLGGMGEKMLSLLKDELRLEAGAGQDQQD